MGKDALTSVAQATLVLLSGVASWEGPSGDTSHSTNQMQMPARILCLCMESGHLHTLVCIFCMTQTNPMFHCAAKLTNTAPVSPFSLPHFDWVSGTKNVASHITQVGPHTGPWNSAPQLSRILWASAKGWVCCISHLGLHWTLPNASATEIWKVPK